MKVSQRSGVIDRVRDQVASRGDLAACIVTPGALLRVQLGVILLLAYGFSLLLTLIPALQASKIYPAKALRYE